MARKMLIVHGYSDGSTSFTDLGDFFVEHAGYDAGDIFYVDYSSMDDDATFRDFADKLDEDYTARFGDERVDVACHSTGALVVRAWLAVRYLRSAARELDMRCPVDRLLMFAPANFGSDLAGMGQSFLGKFRTTFFNTHSYSRQDFLESGKRVLRGLEPASPFQWELSNIDLHGGGYFNPKAPAGERCYPFVLAAGEGYTGLQAKIVKKRKMPGTDGTVRICGTSLNTRKCTLSFRRNRAVFKWRKEAKFPNIPFAVFAGFNHGSIVHPSKNSEAFLAPDGPGALALEALKVTSLPKYRQAAERFADADAANFGQLKGKNKARFQQFFFRVRDDVDLEVDDYFVDFYVLDSNGEVDRKLTERFDRDFEATFYRHSADASYRIMMMNCNKLNEFIAALKQAEAKLAFDVTAKPPLPNVTYQSGHFVVYDGGRAKQPNINFIYPNTTTLADVVLVRDQASKLAQLKDSKLEPAVAERARQAPELSGRARLLD